MANPHRRTLMRQTELRFPILTLTHEGKPFSARAVQCGKCPANDFVRDNSAHGMPDEGPARTFRHRGWYIGKNAGKDLCPACQKPAKRPTAAPQPEPPKGETMPEALSPIVRSGAPVAAPIRQPTPADRRRILDELAAKYDDNAGHYLGHYSDAKVADELNVPRAWVGELRDLICGGPDSNAAADHKAQAIKAVEARLSGIETRALQVLGDIDRDLKACAADLAKLKA